MTSGRAASRLSSVLLLLVAHPLLALLPPTREQVESYRRDGSLARRVAAAYRTGNNLAASHLVTEGAGLPARATLPRRPMIGLPSVGAPRVFALLVAFTDNPNHNTAAYVNARLFGSGVGLTPPFDSLRAFYLRSSYGKLDIQGTTLGWYQAPYPRSSVPQTEDGREGLIKEILAYFDQGGHDFARYDNNGDGRIDYFLVIFTGPPQGWSDFWWGGATVFQDRSYAIDGKGLGAYSFQPERRANEQFDLTAPIHEAGHGLGLPDYYNYEDLVEGPDIGPPGGIGNMDQMDGSAADHNGFSKWLLGWLTPRVLNQGDTPVTLAPLDVAGEVAVLMTGDLRSDPYGEYFLVEHRRRQGNDRLLCGEGLIVWHVDARLNEQGSLRYANSGTEHKLLRLMEADGQEGIENGERADAGDLYRAGSRLASDTMPNSYRYDGSPSNVVVDSIVAAAATMSFRASLGSGCAVYCGPTAPSTVWLGLSALFAGTASTANCLGAPSLEWRIGSVTTHSDRVEQLLEAPGVVPWRLLGTLGDASCVCQGATFVCTDERCRVWHEDQPMTWARAAHAAVVLADGRVLVVGGGGPPEIYDPRDRSWRATGPSRSDFLLATAAALTDGRVLVVGGSLSSAISAEIYDPDSDTWSTPGQLAHTRIAHALARLRDGRVLAAGGAFYDSEGNPYPVLEAELFDPVTGVWSATGSIGEQALGPGMTPLPDGRILLAGESAALIFDPATGIWRQVPGMRFGRRFLQAVALPDGRVVALGGECREAGQSARFAEIFDPATESWSFVTTPMATTRIQPAATVLPSGRVLVVGGADKGYTALSSAEIFDPATTTWTAVNGLAEPRVAHAASLLPDGAVLISGGTATAWSSEPDPRLWVRSAAVERFVEPDTAGRHTPRRRLHPAGH